MNSIIEAGRRTKYPFEKTETWSSVDRGELSQNFDATKAKLSQNVFGLFAPFARCIATSRRGERAISTLDPIPSPGARCQGLE
jgi:hypothetical protein